MKPKRLSRRDFLRMGALATAGAALVSCATPEVIRETIEVEKTVEVEKIVEKTVEVEVEKTVVVEVAPLTVAERLTSLPDKMGSPNAARGWTTEVPDLPRGYPLADPVTITCSRRLDQQSRFCEGDDFDNNPWSRMVKELFNVEFVTAWTWSTDDEAEQKYNLGMASGDLPDFLETIPTNVFLNMVDAGMLEDVTDAYDMYASPRWKAIWREYGDLPWTYTMVNGRKYGVPRIEDLAHNDCILWYREDWLDKVGMSIPTTLDELHDVAMAFKDADLGLGATGSTTGLLASAGGGSYVYAHTWYGSLDAIWGAFGYIPDHWDADGDGLKFAAIRPETKEALTVLNQWYNDGVFRKDFYTLTTSQSMEDVSAGLCGLHFTPSWGANRDTVVNDPTCVWKFTDIPTGPKGFKRRHTENNFKAQPFAFRKGFEHIKEVFDVVDWWDQLWHDSWRRFHGWEGCNYTWEGDKVAPTDVGWQSWIPGPVGTRGGGFLDPKQPGQEIAYRIDEWGKIPSGDWDAYQELFFADPTGVELTNAQSRLFILETAAEGVITQFQRLPTETMKERGADLEKVIDQNLIGFITGERSLAEFDAFVEEWLNLGGEKVTEEVNEWWQNK